MLVQMSQQSTLRPLTPRPSKYNNRLNILERSTESAPPLSRIGSALSPDNLVPKRIFDVPVAIRSLPATPSGDSVERPAGLGSRSEPTLAGNPGISQEEQRPQTSPSVIPIADRDDGLKIPPTNSVGIPTTAILLPRPLSELSASNSLVSHSQEKYDSAHQGTEGVISAPLDNRRETPLPNAEYVTGVRSPYDQRYTAGDIPHSPRHSRHQRQEGCSSSEHPDRSSYTEIHPAASSPNPRLSSRDRSASTFPDSASNKRSPGVPSQHSYPETKDLGPLPPQPVAVQHYLAGNSPANHVSNAQFESEKDPSRADYYYSEEGETVDAISDQHSHQLNSIHQLRNTQPPTETGGEGVQSEYSPVQHSTATEDRRCQGENPPLEYSSGVHQLRFRNSSQDLIAQAYNSASSTSLLSAQLTDRSHPSSHYPNGHHYPESASLPRSSSSVATLLSHPIALPAKTTGSKHQGTGQFASPATSVSAGHYEPVPGHLLPREDVEVFFDHLDSSRQQVMALESSNNSINSSSGGGGGGSGGSGSRQILTSALTGSGGHYVVSSDNESLSYTHLTNAGGGIPPGHFMYYGGGASGGGGASSGTGGGYKSRLLSLPPPTYADHPSTYLPGMPPLFPSSTRSGGAGTAELESIYHSSSNGLSQHHHHHPHHHPASPHAPQGAVLVGDGQDMWTPSGHAQSGEVVYTNLTGATLHTPADSLMKYEYHPHYSSGPALHQGSSLSSSGGASQSVSLEPQSSRPESVLSRQLSRPPNCLDGSYNGRMLAGASTLSSVGGEGAAVMGPYHGQDAMMQAWNYSHTMSDSQAMKSGK